MTLQLFIQYSVNLLMQSFPRYMASNYYGFEAGGKTPSIDEYYSKCLFYLPLVWANDGFNVSLQCHGGNYCSSDKGYRTYGEMQEVEFGFTSTHESALDEYSETSGDSTGTVGRVPISVMQSIFDTHGGIDWDKTMSTENMAHLLKR